MLSFSLARLAEFLGCELVGDAGVLITGVSTIEKAGPGELTFLANLKYAPKIKTSGASAIIAAEPLKDSTAATLVSANPYLDFARVLALFYQPPKPEPGIHPSASIASTAVIGPDPSIGAYAVVGERVTLGANAVLYPHAVIYEGCAIGSSFTAHSHSTVR